MLHRHARPAVAGCFLIGSTGGALVTALSLAVVAGLLSPVPLAIRATVAVAALVALWLRQTGVIRFRLPERQWQIPRQVFTGSALVAAARFGFELGTGVRTYITSSAPYGLAVLLALYPGASDLGGLAMAAIAGVGYGIGRSFIVVANASARRVAIEHPRLWLNIAALLSLAACLVLAVNGSGWVS